MVFLGLTLSCRHASRIAKLRASPHRSPKCMRTLFNLPNIPSFLPFGGDGNEGRSESPANDQTYHERKILPYTRRQLYELVSDVDNYHHFVPYCVASDVLSSELIRDSDSEREFEKKRAQLTVGFLAFKESYVSEVTCKPCESVEAVASSGTPLFEKLVTTWRFQPAHSSSSHPIEAPFKVDASDGPTLLSIDLVFAFANPLYTHISSMFFKQVSTMMVQAFEERCIQVYGKGTK